MSKQLTNRACQSIKTGGGYKKRVDELPATNLSVPSKKPKAKKDKAKAKAKRKAQRKARKRK